MTTGRINQNATRCVTALLLLRVPGGQEALQAQDATRKAECYGPISQRTRKASIPWPVRGTSGPRVTKTAPCGRELLLVPPERGT